MKITVFGLGYVGLSNAILLAQKHTVVAVDVISEKVQMVNQKRSPIVDEDISEYLESKPLDLKATSDWVKASSGADLVIVATPTNYDPQTKYFDTSLVKVVLDNVRSVNQTATIVIKSTIPVGYVEGLKQEGYENIIFVPEFLREGKALHDNLYPTRIVVGEKSARGQKIAELFASCALKENIPILLTDPTEAEAIKLFANTYLAMRVAYFNELDTYAWHNGLNSRDLIRGVGLDPRIGSHYCNPSFGYGGYCLPKDSKQLLANYEGIPSVMIKAIVESNDVRKEYVAERVRNRNCKVVGVYRLVMKSGSDNFRSAAIFDVMDKLDAAGITVLVYEPTVTADHYGKYKVIHDLNEFKCSVDVILANRFDQSLSDCMDKILTRDIFGFE